MATRADVLTAYFTPVAQIFNPLVSVKIASRREDFASGEKRPTSRYCAKRLECEQLAAAVDRHWISGRFGALGRLATLDSGSKLLALQTLRAIRSRPRGAVLYRRITFCRAVGIP